MISNWELNQLITLTSPLMIGRVVQPASNSIMQYHRKKVEESTRIGSVAIVL